MAGRKRKGRARQLPLRGKGGKPSQKKERSVPESRAVSQKSKENRESNAQRQRRLAAEARARFEAQKKRQEAVQKGRRRQEERRRILASAEEKEAFAQKAVLEADLEIEKKKRIERARERLERRQENLRRIVEQGRRDPEDVTIEEYDFAQRALFDAEVNLENAVSPTRGQRSADERKIKEEIVLGKELMEEKVREFYEEVKKEGKLARISPKHVPGHAWKFDSEARRGFVVDRKAHTFVDETTLETILHRMIKSVSTVKEREPSGKVYASMTFLEYGKHFPGSAKTFEKKDPFGTFYQSFDATGSLGGADDAASFEVKLREVFEKRIREMGTKNAAMLVGFQVKSFVEKTKEEGKLWLREFRRKKRVLAKKGAKK